MMKSSFLRTSLVAACFGLGSYAIAQDGLTDATAVPETFEALGERLFFDVNLSANRTQACATCHDPAYGFADPRGAASIGDDGASVGTRNAPTATYAQFSPEFHLDEDGKWRGGQFHDGRAATLEEQARGPFLNPIEMAMPDAAAVVDRIKDDPVYAEAFPALFGADVFDDTERTYDAATRAIAAFERTPVFSPFDSKYDRFLRGEATLTDEEELGRLLFFSQQFTNCNQCHQLSTSAIDPRETFTDYSFHNIGVPNNPALRELNGVLANAVDFGLTDNVLASDDDLQRGRFKTPTLRNVAVTGPYMHNGVFADLRTVILFYNSYNTRNDARKINPETGEPFGPPPVPDTLSMDELTSAPALEDKRIDALVAFLETLTDARYEPLLQDR